MIDLSAALFDASDDVRYVAVYRSGDLSLRQRDGISDASAGETDRFEELLVNPTVLAITRQRGEIDCGGLEYVVIRYGHFFQLVVPVADGHVSVAIEPTAELQPTIARVRAAIERAVSQ